LKKRKTITKHEAILETFRNRVTPLKDRMYIFAEEFNPSKEKQTQWYGADFLLLPCFASTIFSSLSTVHCILSRYLYLLQVGTLSCCNPNKVL